jgi:hypothetical protein
MGGGVARVRLAASARRVAGVILGARDLAVTTGEVVIFEGRGGSSRAVLRVPGEVGSDRIETEIRMPSGSRFAGSGLIRLRFLPDGRCEGDPVRIVQDDGRSLEIRIHPVLGLPSVSENGAGPSYRVMRPFPD